MLERLRAEPHKILTADQYIERFSALWSTLCSPFYKIERRQHFREPGNDSWEAFVAGNWQEALRLAELSRAAIKADRESNPIPIYRVRVAETPISPYLQWEFHQLVIRAEEGEHIHVLVQDEVAHLETNDMLPEVVVLGDVAMFEVLYDEYGEHSGAREFDTALLASVRTEIERLLKAGVEVRQFFDQHVAGLPPPSRQQL